MELRTKEVEYKDALLKDIMKQSTAEKLRMPVPTARTDENKKKFSFFR